MANILHFPSRLFAKSPKPPASSSATEAAYDRSRPGPHLVISPARPTPLLVSTDERWTAIGRVDLDIAPRPNRSHLFSPSDYSDTWPQGAA
jgi:hypothetical protein